MKLVKSVLILLVLSLLFGATSSVLGAGSTINGMRAAFREVPGSFIMGGVEQGVRTYMLCWPQSGQYGFVFMTEIGTSVDVNGLRVGSLTASELVTILQQRGWSYIAAGMLPETIKRVLAAPTLLSALLSIANTSLPSIILLPAIMVPTPAAPISS